eukprot:2173095-Alexandrium_andersonii.AAC.1
MRRLFPSGPAAGPGQSGHLVGEVGLPDWPGSAGPGPNRLPSPCPHPRRAFTDEVRGHLPPGTVREKEAV